MDPALPPEWAVAWRRPIEPHWENKAHPLKAQGYQGIIRLMEPPGPDPGITPVISETTLLPEVPLPQVDQQVAKERPKALLHNVAPRDILLDSQRQTNLCNFVTYCPAQLQAIFATVPADLGVSQERRLWWHLQMYHQINLFLQEPCRSSLQKRLWKLRGDSHN